MYKHKNIITKTIVFGSVRWGGQKSNHEYFKTFDQYNHKKILDVYINERLKKSKRIWTWIIHNHNWTIVINIISYFREHISFKK